MSVMNSLEKVFYIYPDIILELFHFVQTTIFFSVISLQSKGLILTCLVGQFCWRWLLSGFIWLKKVFISVLFWNELFTWYWLLVWYVPSPYLFLLFKSIMSLSSGLNCFWWKISYHLLFLPLYVMNGLLPSGCF